MIVDKFAVAGKEPPVPLRSTAGSSPATARSKERATAETKAKAKPGQRRPAARAVECPA